jgi:protein-S-isoprenylcysteine O-methyltransferase Ste14
MQSMSESDRPGVVAPPPLIYAGALAIGLLLHFFWPLGTHDAPGIRLVGVLLGALGFAFALSGVRELRRWGTNVNPRRPALALVRTGPYRFSRNPAYTGLTGLYLGIALAVNSLWLILMLAPTLVAMSRGVIEREERYMEEKFGEKYLDYKRSVRRWI